MKILVTAGPTREPLDPVRYLSNRSSGKMGYAIAQAALDAGHDDRARQRSRRARRAGGGGDRARHHERRNVRGGTCSGSDGRTCACCARRWRTSDPLEVEPRKIKKGARSSLTLELVPTRDILLRSLRDVPRADGDPRPVVVGFAAETNDLLEHARAKLRAKGCALIVANDVSRADLGFESDENELTLLFASGEIRTLARAPKKKCLPHRW